MTTNSSTPHICVATLKGLSPSEFFKTRRGLTLTTCCVCNLPLEDAQSVSRAMGPICYGRSGYEVVHPTPTQLQNAMGLLVFQKIATEGQTMAYLMANKGDTRKFANILVAYCSWLTSNGRDSEVYNYTPALRALGYDVLARSLEISRCKVRFLKQADGRIAFKAPNLDTSTLFNNRHWIGSYSCVLSKAVGRKLKRKGGAKGLGRGHSYFLENQAEADAAYYFLAKYFAGERCFFNGKAHALPQQSAITKPALIVAYEAQVAAARLAQQQRLQAQQQLLQQAAQAQAAQSSNQQQAATTNTAPKATVSPTRIGSDWGVWSDTVLKVGDYVTVSTRSGKTWLAVVTGTTRHTKKYLTKYA